MMMRGLQDKSRGHKMLCSLAPNSHKTSVSTFLSLSVASAVDSVNYESEYETCARRGGEIMDGCGFCNSAFTLDIEIFRHLKHRVDR